MHADKFIELVFHAKGEQQRLPGGAGRPEDVATWPPPLRGCSGSSLGVGGGCVAPTVIVWGWPASPRLAGLALARLRLLLLGHDAL